MNYYMRNNHDDFQRWFRHIVPFAMFELEQFKHGKSLLIYRNDYDDAIKVKQQVNAIIASLDEKHIDYLVNVLISHVTAVVSNAAEIKLYEKVFKTWSKVCFPSGKSQLKTIDPTLLGGELRAMRLEQSIPAKHIAGLIGVAEKTLYSYEEGIRMMRIDTFYKLCQIYKVQYDKLFEKSEI